MTNRNRLTFANSFHSTRVTILAAEGEVFTSIRIKRAQANLCPSPGCTGNKTLPGISSAPTPEGHLFSLGSPCAGVQYGEALLVEVQQ